MRDINEDGLLKGIYGAHLAKSKNPKIAAKGKAMQQRAATARATSPGNKGKKYGHTGRKEKMAQAMSKKWNDRVNNLTVKGQSVKIGDTKYEPGSIEAFNNWVSSFMGKGRNITPFKSAMSDKLILNYLRDLVDKYYGTDAQEKQAKQAKQTAARKATVDPKYAQNDQEVLTKQLDKKLDRRSAAGKEWEGMKGMASNQSLKNNQLKKQMQVVRQRIAKERNPKTKQRLTDKLQKMTSMLAKESIYNKLATRYLRESMLFEAKNTHMEHLEDLVFNHGYAGAEQALDFVAQTIAMLANGSGEAQKLTVKWDGAPAVVCGIDPADGKFFVGTKTTFNKEPKLVKDKKSLDELYGDREGLHKKLGLALKYLPALGIGGVLQGDFMFDKDDLTTTMIDGEEHVVFTPNTITYAAKVDSDLGKKIMKSKIGIVFHTSYSGSEINQMSATFGPDTSGLNQSKNVWFDDATFKDLTGIATFTPDELSKLKRLIKRVTDTLGKIRAEKFDVVIKNKEFSRFVKPFINQLVRDGKYVTDPMAFLKDFLEFYRGKMQVEMDKIADTKGPDNVGIKNRQAKITKKEEFLEDNSNALLGVLAVYKRLVEIKLLIIKKMQQVEGLGTFIKDGDSYKVTNPEGFVAVGHDGGAVKLVDRLEFSHQNFNAIKAWKTKT